MEVQNNAPKENENQTRKGCSTFYQTVRESRYLTVFIVYVTLMTDMILYSAIVPILPKYFYQEAAEDVVVNSTAFPTLNQSRDIKNFSVFDENNCPEVTADALLQAENYHLSVLLASKQLVQIFATLAVGPVIDKIGCSIPMFIGYIILVTSSLAFAFGETYVVLFSARALQGVGSACTTVAGVALIADKFRDDTNRGKMLGIALGGLGLGVLIGPPFGSVTYQFGGKAAPFIVLAGLSTVIAILQSVTTKLEIKDSEATESMKSTYFKLLKDPYVMLSSLAIICGGLPTAVIEVALPMWMMLTLCSQEWQLGLIFLPGSLGFLLATVFFGWTGHHIGRWMVCFISFFVAAAALVGTPFCTSFGQLIAPSFFIGLGAGMLDAAVYPIVGYLVDKRFEVTVYGGAYALAEAMYCVAFSIGPLVAGFTVPEVGFKTVLFITAALTLLGILPLGFLRKPLASNERFCTSCCQDKDGEQIMLLQGSSSSQKD